MDYIIRGMEKEGNFRFFIGSTTELVEKLRKTHNTSPVASAAIGRVATATSIMGYMLKNDKDKISIQVSGSNKIKKVMAISNSNCEIKGYISGADAELPLRSDGKLDVGGAIGPGKIAIVRDLGLKEPYIGNSELITGEIAEDLANYFAKSEQQPSAIALGVLVDKNHTIRAAGGYIIQVLPDAAEESITKLEENLKKVDSMTTMIDNGLNPENIMERIFEGFDVSVIDKKQVFYNCNCSRNKMEKVLLSIGKEELMEMEKDDNTEIVCHFCNTKYNFVSREIEKMLEKA